MIEILEARIVTLEIELSHHDKTIEELSQMVSRQWEVVERMERQIKALKEAVLDLEENGGPPANQKPPHY